MSYNITVTDEELKALRDLWFFSNYECINNKSCFTCHLLNKEDSTCNSNVAYNIVKKCIECSVKFGREESDT